MPFTLKILIQASLELIHNTEPAFLQNPPLPSSNFTTETPFTHYSSQIPARDLKHHCFYGTLTVLYFQHLFS